MNLNRLDELIRPNVTHKDIAERYGCTISFVGHVAKGRRPPPAQFKLVASEMLGLPVSVIFPEDND